ncbi:MAG TPA: hypothetical protein ENN17_10015 [bacterium]|nr:hypothetical protein [bacterium]
MFKVTRWESVLYGLLFISGLLFMIVLGLFPTGRTRMFLSAAPVTLFAVVAFTRSLSVPIIAFSENGFYIRSGLFLSPKFHRFDAIREVRAIKSDHEILCITTQGETVHISLRRLSPKDRIRCIFLLESDVNRKHIG